MKNPKSTNLKSTLSLIALAVGLVVAALTFMILFAVPMKDLFPVAYLPLGLAALTSFTLAAIDPEDWMWRSFFIACPTIVMAVWLFWMLWDEGSAPGGGWPTIMVIALAVCGVSGVLGALVGALNMQKKKDS
jgi:4-amino-4-deoxy-L-arabinose transferase-like glycosyltransferase